MSKYVLPIGVDAENLVNPLNEAISTMEKAENAAVGTGKSINDALNTGAKAAEKLDEKLKPIGRDLQGVFSRWRAEILAAMDANLGEAA